MTKTLGKRTAVFKLTDAEWALIESRLPNRNGQRARPAHDNRAYFEGMLWVATTGESWRAMPETYGHWNSIFRRYRRWMEQGVLDNVARGLRKEIGALQYESKPFMQEGRAFRFVLRVRKNLKAKKELSAPTISALSDRTESFDR